MYVLTILLITFFSSKATAQTSIEYSINVGTSLFSHSDLQKTHWSASDIGLLKARRHFQDLLPPPNFIDTTNGNYVSTLLNYFKDTYSTIKREAACPISDDLMTTAFSDALGGYMKLWVLPISKLAFYGGSVSQEDIIRLFRFQSEIKRFVGTDGRGWRSPDKNLLNSITFNIAPPSHVTKRMKNPCENIAYYEKTNRGMSIPIPYVDWGESSNTMFLPLRNQSLISLDSPDYSNSLFTYYDAAKNCIDASSNGESNDFDDRFQTWLNTDVVPHLSDDTIYLPLGSVLSLVNKSREMCDSIIDLYIKKPPVTHTNYVIAGIPIDFSSRKTQIIGVILILEVLWCIPALLYLVCAKSKKRENSNIYTLLDIGKNRKSSDEGSKGFFSTRVKRNLTGNHGFKIGTRPRSGNVELETQFIPSASKGSIATDTRSYFGSEVCSGVSVIHESRPTPQLKSSMKKIRCTPAPSNHQTVIIHPSKSCKTYSSKKSDKRMRQTPASSIVTDSYTIGNTDPSTTFSSLKQINIPILSATKEPSHHSQTKPQVIGDVNCPCLTCLEAEVGSEITIVNDESKSCVACSDKNIEIDMEPMCTLVEHDKIAKKVKKVGLRLESGRPYLEIMIDKPKAEICVGIGGTFDPLKLNKKSKIPKRLPKIMAAQVTECTSPMKGTVSHKNKSLIPQPKKRPVDDIVIKSNKPKQNRKDRKLNVTL